MVYSVKMIPTVPSRVVLTLLLLGSVTALANEGAPLLDHGVVRLRAPELSSAALERVVLVDGEGHRNPVAAEAVKQLEDGWITFAVPPGIDSGVLEITVAKKTRSFAFQSHKVAPVAQPQWDATTRAACLAIAGYWAGTIRGNDPNVQTTVSIELDGDCRSVHGILNWRSATSGSNDRVFSGTWDRQAHTLVAADVALNRPMPLGGWRFCPIDRYHLALSADGARLSGRYDSKACKDHAAVELHRLEASEQR